jgi:hypothetical protein
MQLFLSLFRTLLIVALLFLAPHPDETLELAEYPVQIVKNLGVREAQHGEAVQL